MSEVDLKRWHNNLQKTDHSKHKHAKKKQKNGCFCTYGPEFDEILDDCSTNYCTVEWGVCQEQDKELVVWESNTVIHPKGKEKTENTRKKVKCVTLYVVLTKENICWWTAQQGNMEN